MRTACLLVPDLPLVAELRAHPEWHGEPLVVASTPTPRGEIVSVSPEAARLGIRRGQSVTRARAACSALRVRGVSTALERSTRHALRDVALSFSPRVALLPPSSGAFLCEAAVLLDASGITSLFRSEEGFAAALGERARRLGLTAHVSVAGSQCLAHLAARRIAAACTADARESEAEGRTRVIRPGREQAFLAPLPIDLLDPDDALAERLQRFGIHTLRDLLTLPRRALGARLGPRALELADRARGHGREAPLPAECEERLAEALDLPHPVDRLEPLLFVLQGLLSRLLERLAVRHLGCEQLALRLELSGGARDARSVRVAAPTGDLRVWIRLLHQVLEARPPEAEVEAVRLETRGVPPRRDQLDLFRPAGPAPDTLSQVLAELGSLCGSERVGAPEVPDSHHPDALSLGLFAPKPGGHVGSSGGGPEPPDAGPTAGPTPLLALRVLRPPVSAQVRLRGDRPEWVRSPVANGPVLRCAGPWRTTGGWWSREERFAFDHFDVLTDDGTVFRLRFDHVARIWQIDAVYD